MIAIGVAKPRAHGQAITKTEIAIVKANVRDSPPIKYQPSPETIDNPITIGTKIPEILSANFSIGALDTCAYSTNFSFSKSAVFLPTYVTTTYIINIFLLCYTITLSNCHLLTP